MKKTKQIAIISGKGGSGKTTFTSNLAYYFNESVIADCDVDAPDTWILLKPDVIETKDFKSGKIAVIDGNKCTRCGVCIKYCKFDALKLSETKAVVNGVNCEGCGFCKEVCPANAIELQLKKAGEYFESDIEYGKMVHAKLIPGQDNSGKLVHVVRQKAKDIAENGNYCPVIIDGPPGIGCTVMSAITGIDYAIIVTEPSLSGESDFKRVAALCMKQDIKCFLVINKSGINDKISESIKTFAYENNISFLGEIPFDKLVVSALVNKDLLLKSFPETQVSKKMIEIFDKITKIVQCN